MYKIKRTQQWIHVISLIKTKQARTLKTIGSRLHASPTTAFRRIKELRKEGLIIIYNRADGGFSIDGDTANVVNKLKDLLNELLKGDD